MDSLGLIGDGDEVDLFEDIEQTFAIKLTNEDVRNCQTMGDLENAVWRHLQTADGEGKKCASVLAFYELRRVIRKAGMADTVRPKTSLSGLAVRPTALARLIRRETGLNYNFDATRISDWGGYLLLASLFVGFPLAAEVRSGAAVFIVMIGVLSGCAMIRYDPGAFESVQTVGEAARKLVDFNFGAFLARGARLNRENMWNALKAVAADSSGSGPAGIERSTRLLYRSPKVA